MAQVFRQRFSSTRRGARLARCLAQAQLVFWGTPYGSPLSADVGLVVGELAANAVLHGRLPGRDFELLLEHDARSGAVRVTVSDARGDAEPPAEPPPVDPWSAEGGRGLLLVASVARAWGVVDRGPGKSVWAELGGVAPTADPGRKTPETRAIRAESAAP
ncbi:ATP-binding protein [Streptomyces sp. NPDC058674]|uniref:ATP-binding protein n=1 Tax=Streptomyces sp. NPDC058674 TaxID=3346592 RepID=UPI00364F1FBF